MDTAKSIKKLRESTGMSRKEFSEHTGIPVRTLEDWEAGRRTPPEYVPKLIAYQLRYEELVKNADKRVQNEAVKNEKGMKKHNCLEFEAINTNSEVSDD